MTNLDFEASLKHVFIILHIGFLLISAGYLRIGNPTNAIFFSASSILCLIYYVLYKQVQIQRRIKASINLLEQEVGERNNEEEESEDE